MLAHMQADDQTTVNERLAGIESRLASGTVYHVNMATTDVRWMVRIIRELLTRVSKLEHRVHNQKIQLRALERKRREGTL